MNEIHTAPQWKRVMDWLMDHPGSELSQSMTNHWRPPVYRLGAVIYRLRHEHGMDIINRMEDRRAHYKLAPVVGTTGLAGLPFPSDSQSIAENLLDMASLLSQQGEALRRLARVVEGLGVEPSR